MNQFLAEGFLSLSKPIVKKISIGSIALLISVGISAQHTLNTQNKNSSRLQTSQRVNEATTSTALNSGSEAENISPIEAMKGKEEITAKRDLFSKTYRNNDGSFTALIGAGPIHYEKNGRFYDIDLNITSTGDANFPYANTTNLFESHFGASAQLGVKNKTIDGEVSEFLNAKMYWEVNGNALNTQTAANASLSIQSDKAYYHNLYGNISAEYIMLSTKRELNYLIPAAKDLGVVPQNAQYLVFYEEVMLPSGWQSNATPKGIEIKNKQGKLVYLYSNPVSHDAAQTLERTTNTIYESHQTGNILSVKTKVKTAWLLDSGRQFPVKVDPTVSVEPDNTANWTKAVFSDGDESWSQYGTYGLYGSVSEYYWLQFHIKFNTTTVPSGSSISDVKGYIYQTARNGTKNTASQWLWRNSADPTTTSGTTLFNSATTDQSTAVNTNNTNNSWKNSVFTAAGRTYVKNGIDNSTFVAAAVYSKGTWNFGNYYNNAIHTSSNRPYLSITYTAPATPPSCATLIGPANGATAVAHQGQLAWNAIGGATSYDVYFGTASTPPSVSTSQAGTTYNVGTCLLPNTTYYWKVVPNNSNGSATGCATWSFTTDNKLNIYKNDWETATTGFFGTSGTSVDGWYTNNNSGTGGAPTSGYNNTWTVANSGLNVISGYSAGVTALYNGGLAGDFFDYWSDLGEIHRWIYRPFDMRGLRDIEVSFRWKCGGESNEDYGSVISSINSGANWAMETQGGLYNDGKYWNSPSTIRSQSITFPSTRNNQQNFVLGFKWDDQNGNGVSNDPSFVVDDIVIKACPYEGVIASNVVGSGVFEWTPTGSTQATLTVNGSHACAQYQWEQSTTNGSSWSNAVGGSGATTASYTTPSNLTVNTWYRCKVYFGTGCTGVYQDNVFKVNFTSPLVCATLSNLAVQLGTPFNGTSHYLNLSWDAFNNATGYDIELSTDNSTWGSATPASVTTNSASLNMGDNPNKQYWFRVRAKDAFTTCNWTNSSPIFTAADNPALPSVTNATTTSLDVSIQAETPVANPSITTYSIYCQTTGQYVQANGSLGTTEVFQTKAAWGTITATGLTSNTNYCFLLKAKNGNGHIVGGEGTTIATENFTTSSNFSNQTGSGPTNKWWTPGTVTSGTPMVYNATGSDCSSGGGYVGYNGAWNNYHGSFLRSPQQNCTGMSEVEMTFDLSNSYFATQPNDRVYFNMWAPTAGSPSGTYISATSVNGTSTNELKFTQVRSCQKVTVKFDLATVTDKSAIMFYINTACGYNNSNVYYYKIDNITLLQAAPSACASTLSGPNTWKGNTTDWFTASNWTSNQVPNACGADAVIPTTPSGGNNFPVLTTTASVGNLSMEENASITINGSGSLQVCGDLSGGASSAALVNGSGANGLAMTGNAAQSISGKLTFNKLNINNSSTGVTNSGELNVVTALVLTDGNFTNNSGATVTLKSNVSGTAYLDDFTSGTAGNYIGKLSVERYFSNTADGYRDIASPVATTVADLADDFTVFGQNGVQCWYAYNPYPNVQVYNEALSIVNGNYYEGWLSYTGNSNALSAMKGVAIRTYKGTPFTLDFSGAPYTGAKSVPVTKTTSVTTSQDGWNFVGNPYPSPILWSAVKAKNNGVTSGTVYSFKTTGEYTGNWGSHNGTTGVNGATDDIAIGQGFFVLANGNDTFSMDNSVRTANATTAYYKNNALPNEVRLKLSDSLNSDEVVTYTDAAATPGYETALDAVKIPAGSTVYLSFNIQNKEYAINVTDEITEQTVLPLVVWAQDTGSYSFELLEQNLNNLTPYLRDENTGIEKDLTLGNISLPLNGKQTYNNYSVVFKQAVSTGIDKVEQAVKIWSNGNNVHVSRSTTNEAEITILNLLGQQIFKTTTNGKFTTIPLSGTEAWYAIVKVTEGDKVRVEKVFITNK